MVTVTPAQADENVEHATEQSTLTSDEVFLQTLFARPVDVHDDVSSATPLEGNTSPSTTTSMDLSNTSMVQAVLCRARERLKRIMIYKDSGEFMKAMTPKMAGSDPQSGMVSFIQL